MGLFDIFKKKYNKNPKDNYSQVVYGAPKKKKARDIDDKYNIKPERNRNAKVYGIPDPKMFK